MELVDSHCHIHDQEVLRFALSRQKKQTEADFTPEKIFNRMEQAQVRQAICVGTTRADSLVAGKFASQYDNIFWSYGIHPEEVATTPAEEWSVKAFEKLASTSPVAIGEVGLDYHSEGYNRTAQIRLLEEMIQLALNNNLPMIFHVREAFTDFFAVLNNFHGVRGVVHSFSDSQANLDEALKRDFYIGVNGLATFAKLPTPPLTRMILETDSPFLAPTPLRGKVNDPSHIREIAEWVAGKLKCPIEQVAEITTTNTRKLFRL